MFSVCYILTQRMSALEIVNDSALYKCSLNNNNNSLIIIVDNRKRLEGFHHTCLRKLFNATWKDKVRKETIRDIIGQDMFMFL